jgi:hypothetical protein
MLIIFILKDAPENDASKFRILVDEIQRLDHLSLSEIGAKEIDFR